MPLYSALCGLSSCKMYFKPRGLQLASYAGHYFEKDQDNDYMITPAIEIKSLYAHTKFFLQFILYNFFCRVPLNLFYESRCISYRF